jgi:hypothetical protein
MPTVTQPQPVNFDGNVFKVTFIASKKDDSFQIGILEQSSNNIVDIAKSIKDISVSYSMDLSPQIQISMFDVGMAMLANNYFNIGRVFVYKSRARVSNGTSTTTVPGPNASSGLIDFSRQNSSVDGFGWIINFYEIASVSVQAGEGTSPTVSIELRSRPVMQMKRDRNPGSIRGKSEAFVQQAALRYGLGFYTEKTSKDKKINKASSDRRADSLWDVLSNLASEAKFSLFESDGILFFASMRYIYGQWGPEQFSANIIDEKTSSPSLRVMNSWYVRWPYVYDSRFGEQTTVNMGGVNNTSRLANILTPMACPTFRRSDADTYQVDGSLSLDRYNATVLRPGMTIYVGGVPTFEDFYIITEVSFGQMSTSPVNVSFKKPEREDKFITDIPIGFIGSASEYIYP